MVEALRYVLIPIGGAVVGWLTNWIAIKMLFYPQSPVKLFGREIPWMHGLFPRHRNEFARKTGDLVSDILKPAELIESISQNQALYEQLYEQFNTQMDQRLFTAIIGEKRRRQLYNQLWTKLQDTLQQQDITERIKEFGHSYVMKLDAEELFSMFDSYIGEHLGPLTWLGAIIGFLIGCIQLLVVLL